MSNDRELILKKVTESLSSLPSRASLPEYAGDLAVMRKVTEGRDLLELFSERISLVNGSVVTNLEKLRDRLIEGNWKHGYCDPTLWPSLAPILSPHFTVETIFDRTRIDDYAFAVTRAVGAIAETGTIILNDSLTSYRLAALTPWVHIAYVRKSEIMADMSLAVSALGKDPNVIWCTGSSSTADVEGILIRGVHGPGVQIALVIE
jgi:L-lactate dehydrogenase complex protein LldG